MKFKRHPLVEGLAMIAVFCGIYALSQGTTFAQPSEYRSTETLMGRHADLIVAVGAGLCILSVVVVTLMRRIKTLEDELHRIEKAAG